MDKKTKQVELRSEKVQNIIGQIPPIFVRHGMTMLVFSLLMIVGVAAFIPYQPSVNTEITVTQDSLGVMHYFAKIPQWILKQKAQFTGIIVSSFSEQLLPTRFQIVTVSDTVQLSQMQAWHIAMLSAKNNSSQIVKLETTVIFPGKIELRKRTILKWVMEKIRM